MAPFALNSMEPITPTEREAGLAAVSAERLASLIQPGQGLRLSAEGATAPIELPHAALQLLLRLLSEMAQGNAITVIPFHAELTTQNAADVLGVSRPFIVKQIESGLLPHRMVGTHRRVLFKDLMEYKRMMDQDRHAALDELAAESQRLGLY
jgi:excisionase family DNA binding protein